MANGRQLTQLYLNYARVNRRLLLSPEVADRVLSTLWSFHPFSAWLAVNIHLRAKTASILADHVFVNGRRVTRPVQVLADEEDGKRLHHVRNPRCRAAARRLVGFRSGTTLFTLGVRYPAVVIAAQFVENGAADAREEEESG